MSGWSAFANPGVEVAPLGPPSSQPAEAWPDDMVVEMPAHWTWPELRAFLEPQALSIPWHNPDCLTAQTLARTIDEALPHALESEFGSWRDWVVGLQVRLVDGTIAKVGSRVVKNVAGYDAQKLFIGGMASFGQILRVTLRVIPARRMPELSPITLETPGWIQRVQPIDFNSAQVNATLSYPNSATIFGQPGDRPRRSPGDWVRWQGCALKADDLRAEEIRLLQRAKEVFDPSGRCGTGLLGIV